jgi:hypothetical protein
LRPPARDLAGDGVVDLGPQGAALVCEASTVNFALRTPAEQQALISAFARVLHAVIAPVQVLVRVERADLTAHLCQLDQTAGGLPHPALEAAARIRRAAATDSPPLPPGQWRGWRVKHHPRHDNLALPLPCPCGASGCPPRTRSYSAALPRRHLHRLAPGVSRRLPRAARPSLSAAITTN